jgi:hypothetical protein
MGYLETKFSGVGLNVDIQNQQSILQSDLQFTKNNLTNDSCNFILPQSTSRYTTQV